MDGSVYFLRAGFGSYHNQWFFPSIIVCHDLNYLNELPKRAVPPLHRMDAKIKSDR
jgi:hypothetical protein